ncbi:MAG: hypothetical protein MN733_05050 [Nitrososphaera sp.]|nr:hypothetical protein [Nitrososphaera sp.]
MAALRVFELLGTILFVIFVVTQAVVPLWCGRRLFPLFRKKDAERRLVDAHERVDEARLTNAAEDLERTLKRKRTK